MKHAAIAISPDIAPGAIFALDPLPLRCGHVITFLGSTRPVTEVTVIAANDNLIQFYDGHAAFVATPWPHHRAAGGQWWQISEAAAQLH